MLLSPSGTSVPGPPKTEMTSHLAQTLTGHGGFSQYLHRFKLKDSPYCACDPAKIQDVLHVLEECPMFLRERGTGNGDWRHCREGSFQQY
ncbi:Retrovirus-related Pol polyprotein from type-1 retrotransposable element R1 [Eumeta japonica]|uniref:Retrovirus-related Pol polyprotein from type-1 retrotransposable element R1 n=1 Tax=Eumeta variegata TaxID=151549 RepID=A0A4C2ADK1_EUMVA|nr:Retrovirus-related Pol polyprotein from type-1 retrotransposable element R1 [Eumeta japonica]